MSLHSASTTSTTPDRGSACRRSPSTCPQGEPSVAGGGPKSPSAMTGITPGGFKAWLGLALPRPSPVKGGLQCGLEMKANED